MKSTCKNKFLTELIKIRQKPENHLCNQAILILDEVTTKILSDYISIQDLFDCGIKYLTKSQLNKKPQPNSMGIYYISESSIQSIQKDFNKKLTYFSINIICCENISQKAMTYLANNQNLIERLASLSQFKFPIEYLWENLGLFREKHNYIKNVYNQNHAFSDEIASNVYQAVIAGFSKVNSLEIYYNDESKFGITMANRIKKCCQQNFIQEVDIQNQNQLKEMSKISFKSNNLDEIDNLKIILFDRNIDLVSPMMRNFYYFPMITDLFDIRDFKDITIKKLNKQSEELKIASNDKVFLQFKNKHISEVFNQINHGLQKFTSENKAAKFQKQRQVKSTNNDLKEVLKQLPEYTKTINSYNRQIDIMKQVSFRSKKQKLTQIGQLEHLIITSLTSQAEVQKDKKIYKKALQFISSNLSLNINDQAKLRILFLMLQSLQLSQKQKEQLVSYLQKIPGCEGFGIFFEKKPTGKLRFNPIYKKQSIFLDRHQCIAAKRLQQILIGKPAKQFRKLQVEIMKNKLSKFKKNGRKQKQKVLVVMVGGLSINQMSNMQRFIQKIQNHQIFYLTDHLSTPKIFLEDLKSIFKSNSK